MLDTTALMTAEAPARLAELDKILAPFNRSDAPGLIVAVALNEQIIYRKAVGMANLEHGVANTPRTKVRIASTSKHFTGIGILLLVEDGLIKLDEPMQTYLPEFPVLSSKGPTIQQLLNHTSGWRAHDEIWAIANGLAFNEPGQGMPAMARQSALNFEPGTRMAYSNGGYHLLAKIIERVSGKTYDQFLKERLFVPLGMPDTESVVTDLDVIAGLADRYIPTESGGWKHGVYPCELDGGGSLASTADDMLRWMAHLRSDTKIVGTVESWNALHKTATLTSGSKVCYGAGLARHPYRGVDIMHHAGAVLGATSQMLTVPQFGLDIIVLVNGAAIHPATLAIQIVDMVLDDVLPEKREPRPASADFPAILDRTYVNHDSGGVIGFSAAAEKLGFSWQAAAPAVMHHAGDRLWIGIQDLPINDMELKAHVAQQAEAPAEIEILEGGSPVTYSLLPKEVPSVASVADKLVGNHHSPDLDATAAIELSDDKLRMTFQGRFGQQVGVLDLLSEDVLTFTSTNGLLARLGKSALFVDRDSNGNVTALRLSSVRTRNVVLKRV